MVAIFYLSSQQGTSLAPTYFWNYLASKAAHLFWYFLLSLSFYFATKSIPASILLTISYGIFDEVHQTFVPRRTGRVSDVIIDSTASGFMGVAVYVYNRIRGKA